MPPCLRLLARWRRFVRSIDPSRSLGEIITDWEKSLPPREVILSEENDPEKERGGQAKTSPPSP